MSTFKTDRIELPETGSARLVIGPFSAKTTAPLLDFYSGSNKLAMQLDGDSGKIWIHGLVQIEAGKKGETPSRLRLGGMFGDEAASGLIVLQDNQGNETVTINGRSGEVTIKESYHLLGATLRIGSGGQDGALLLKNAAGTETLRLDGKAGDIVFANGDCAEDFDVADPLEIVAGAVMVLDQNGKLRQCEQAYDTAVAGVIAGAGDYRPGIVLDRQPGAQSRAPISMLGKVSCLVDAETGKIRPGDLLTSSSRRGHAMRALDNTRAFGAILGKALAPLESGQGMLPIMVARH
jgi:hypothetical protein